MVKFWVWTSEIIFIFQPLFLVPSLAKRKYLIILIGRYLLNALLLAWWFTNLPWLLLLIILAINLKLYGYQVRHLYIKDEIGVFKERLSEFIAFFSVINFVFALPFWGDPNKAISRSLHRLINIAGVGAVVYALTIRRLHDAWSCYNDVVFPHMSDYNYGMCPEDLNDQDQPICGQPFIHCDDRVPLRNGQLFYEIAVALVSGSGVLYILGCPFF